MARIYGIFTVKLEDLDPIHLLLMENTMQYLSEEKVSVNSTFDLKGSLKGRLNKDPDPSNTDILKDLNIMQKRKSHDILNFSKEKQKEVLDTMKKDTEFLKAHNLMDYSLLLAIEYNFTKQDHGKWAKQ